MNLKQSGWGVNDNLPRLGGEAWDPALVEAWDGIGVTAAAYGGLTGECESRRVGPNHLLLLLFLTDNP